MSENKDRASHFYPYLFIFVCLFFFHEIIVSLSHGNAHLFACLLVHGYMQVMPLLSSHNSRAGVHLCSIS